MQPCYRVGWYTILWYADKMTGMLHPPFVHLKGENTGLLYYQLLMSQSEKSLLFLSLHVYTKERAASLAG